jgi:hypothetical protein
MSALRTFGAECERLLPLLGPPSVGRRETDALAAGKEYVDTGEQDD